MFVYSDMNPLIESTEETSTDGGKIRKRLDRNVKFDQKIDKKRFAPDARRLASYFCNTSVSPLRAY